MIDLEQLNDSIKKNVFKSCYIFCGLDEQLIKENVGKITDKIIGNSLRELNLVQFDGKTVLGSDMINACETLPFMSEKKVVLVYRAAFLTDSEDRERKNVLEEIKKYIENIPQYCVLIMYYVFESKREKPSQAVSRLDKKVCVVKADKLKGDKLEAKIKSIFEERGKQIGRSELKLFCSGIENDMGVAQNEIDKLFWYTYGREITREDVLLMFSEKSDEDIFDLVDYLAQKKAERAVDILNELIFKGEKIVGILFMVERQFKLLLSIKLGIEEHKGKNELVSQLKLNPYICEKMITQSKKFSVKQLENTLKLCIDTEERLKSSSLDGKTEMEMLIINAMIV
jgi:DNA polymerase III subunit delta